MKHIYLNLKRFDIPPERGGVNRIAPIKEWGKTIIEGTQEKLKKYKNTEFVMYFPEAHLIGAANALEDDANLEIGAQSVYRADTAVGGNFGAFTTNRTANVVKEIGGTSVIIGHCEERNDKMGILAEAGVTGAAATQAVNRLLNAEIKEAQKAGLKVLYCIGEKEEELANWDSVLREQLEIGLNDVDKNSVVIAYEPIWSIGPGKTPADKPYITKVAKFVKTVAGESMDVVYGGGLKSDNAKMLASIPEIAGGLIALTRFSGEIGFYPEEYLEIIDLYLN
ncbi:triose-phosphate isomerase [Candidatus Epulonipiscium viviparus]|uniref:triose-phosphate isomerase n=1 Tax=Candidatus Epulonipiscium viviparus TaxID=420336 RepID=UPI00016C008B|nr:triose-phosphate isomerase family protein [Candidatus Epulopiscium viviparus]